LLTLSVLQLRIVDTEGKKDHKKNTWFANNGDIVGLHFLSGNQLVAQALVDVSFMFLQMSCENLQKGTHIWS
jgi:hypothetical protein